MSTITPIGAGAAVTGNNASLNPGFHASTAVGDFVVLYATIRSSGAGDVNVPAGWTSLVYSGHHRVMGRFYEAGDAAPTVTFGAGAAGDDTIAQTATFRGVSREMLTAVAASNGQLNGSAANIAYPALTVPKDRHLVLATAWKQDDASAYSTPAGFTSLGLTSTTTGNDASQAWYYQVQTTAANISAGTITVTGGAAAISRAVLLALKPAATITVTPQDTYPPRVLISVTDLTLGDAVEIYRVVAGERTLVRAASDSSVTDPAFLRVDAELPFGVPVSYVAVVNGVEYTTSPVTYTLPGGKVALSDAITGLSAEVVVLSWPERSYNPQSSVFAVGGRNVVVSGELGMFEGDVELYTETTSSAQNLKTVLANATQGIVQFRQPGGYDDIDSYVAVTSYQSRRWSQDGTDERRVHQLHVVEVDGWAPALLARGFTYDDLADAYTGLTYANLAADFPTYLALAQGDFS